MYVFLGEDREDNIYHGKAHCFVYLDSPEEWLDELNTLSIYRGLSRIIELWGLNVKVDVEAKKLQSIDRHTGSQSADHRHGE